MWQKMSPFLSLSVLTAIFLGAPGLASFIGAKDDGCGGDNRSCKSSSKSSPLTNQHPTFYVPNVLPVAQLTVSIKALKGLNVILFIYLLSE